MERILYMIEALVNEIAGPHGVRLLKEMLYKENIGEIRLSELLKLGVNQIRSLLYKLHAYNLVYSTRKKDKDKGWYNYYWTFNFSHARDLLTIRKKKRLEKINEELKSSHIEVYECKNKCIALSLDKAMHHNFRCPECEQLLEHKDTKSYFEGLRKEVTQIETDLDILKQPIKFTLKKEEHKERVKKKKVAKVKKKVIKKIKKIKIKKKEVKKKKVRNKIKKVKVKKKGFFSKLKKKIRF